ncbi:MAG: alpha/beta hydrolase [Persicimonas sp.]
MKPPPIGSTAARLLKGTLYGAVRMPRGLTRRVFGPAPENDRGAPLDWQTHVLLNVLDSSGVPELQELGPDQARQIYKRSNRIFGAAPRPLHAIEDLGLEGPEGPLPARLYRPRTGRLPACVFFHGGGFVMGSLDGYDGLCSRLAECADCVVISVDYRLAPEHPFPAAVDDAIAAYEDVVARADQLGVDADRIAVAGDSAGGNLAAVVCQAMVERQGPRPAHQLLIYPKTDHRRHYASRERFAEGFFLESPLIDWFLNAYLGGADVADDPRISPILFDALDALPPTTIVTAGFDPLRDEGAAYASRLEEAGVFIQNRCCEGLVHGFVTMDGLIDTASRALDDICEGFRSQLHRHETPHGPDSN